MVRRSDDTAPPLPESDPVEVPASARPADTAAPATGGLDSAASQGSDAVAAPFEAGVADAIASAPVTLTALAEPQREIVENQETDLEAEKIVETGARRTPWDPAKIRVTTKPWSLRQAVDDIKDGTIDLAPDFQRPSVWTAQQRSRLIESILLGIPLPAFYFSADGAGQLQVVDGVQRLSSIVEFASGQFALQDLEYLTLLEAKRFAELDAPLRRRFHQTQIVVNVIEPGTPVEVKFNIFKRINTGGEPLTPQEIRHALSQSRSRDLLRRMTASELFHRATGGAFRDDRRMAGRELALRFVAFRLDPELRAYETAETADDFLSACALRLDDPGALSDAQLGELEHQFAHAMTAAWTIFGDHAFRKWPARSAGSDRRAPLNRALFDSWSTVLADHEVAALELRKPAIVAAARDAFLRNPEYVASISAGTADLARVRLRIEVARTILREA